jgi:hypothetical protein
MALTFQPIDPVTTRYAPAAKAVNILEYLFDRSRDDGDARSATWVHLSGFKLPSVPRFASLALWT